MTPKTANWLFGVLEAAAVLVILVLFTTHRNVDVSPNQILVDYMAEEFDYVESFTTDEYQVFVYKVRGTIAKPDRTDTIYIAFPYSNKYILRDPGRMLQNNDSDRIKNHKKSE